MLEITIPPNDLWDEKNEQFIHIKETNLRLEHSLVSLSKWESKWNKVFLSKKEKSTEETIDYVKCMTLTKNVDPNVYYGLTPENFKQINDYIAAPMTATYFSKEQKKGNSREQVTSELIYYWMIAYNIPFECQKWHLNRLITLVRVCEVKNEKPKKMSKGDIMRRNASINAARRKKYHSKG